MTQKLYIDIETLPADEQSHKNLKFLFDRKKEKAEVRGKSVCDFEQWLLGTSFDGAFGQILCIGYAANNEQTGVIFNDKDEKKTLEEFWQMANNFNLFIGHNIMDFDLRFIYQRSIVQKVRPTLELNFARYRSAPIFDTMKEWVKWANMTVGLEHLALALGIPTPKDGIDGSQVFNFYRQGKVNDILEYCKRDVETARAVYKRMTFGE